MSKPIVYIDQNILDKLHKNPHAKLAEDLRINFQVIFSEENLAEVERCGDQKAQYAATFALLNPKYLRVSFDENGHLLPTASLEDFPFEGCLEKRRQIVPGFEKIKMTLHKPLLKALGGLTEKTFDEIHEETKSAYEEVRQISGDDSKDVTALIEEKKRSSKEFLSAVSDYTGMETIRRSVNAKPVELNNFQGKDAIARIWSELSKSDYIKDNNVSFERFFGFENIPSTIHEDSAVRYKIYLLHTMLNAIGYFTDDSILKEKRFEASQSDAMHLTYAAFADKFLSFDMKLCRKAGAIYSHLGVGPRVYLLQEEKKSQ